MNGLSLCTVFDPTSSKIDEGLSINPSANVLSLQTLVSIIRTGSPILVELTNLVNSVIIFLSQMTLLRWLAFLSKSQTVILTVLPFWIYFFTLAFPSLGNFDHVVVSVSIDFPSNSQRDTPFHRIAYDYSQADWDGLRNHLRDDPWENMFKLAASEFC